jgi:hypothetical protein
MTSKAQSTRTLIVIIIGVAFLLLALTPLALAGETATPKETIQAAQTNVAATVRAVRTSIPLTSTAFKSTSESVKSGFKATTGALRLTSTALASNLRVTGTAFKSTLSAGATSLNATVSAVRTSVATQLAPITDSRIAIEYYATNILGTTVTVLDARKGTLSDTQFVTQTDAGAQIIKQVIPLAGVTHYAKLSNGYALLSYGVGLADDTKLEVALTAGSAAVYTFDIANTGTLDPNSALALAQATFPNLAKYNYIPWSTPRGYAWLTAGAEGIADTRTVKGGAGWVMLYVLPTGSGRAKVSATVVVGGFIALAPK